MAHRVAPEAEAELDNIWYYVAKESGSIEIAGRLIESITQHFYLLASHPHIGRQRPSVKRGGNGMMQIPRDPAFTCTRGSNRCFNPRARDRETARGCPQIAFRVASDSMTKV